MSRELTALIRHWHAFHRTADLIMVTDNLGLPVLAQHGEAIYDFLEWPWLDALGVRDEYSELRRNDE